MGSADEQGYDFDVPVVASRREFFEVESALLGPAEDLDTDLEPDEIADGLIAMRRTARRRTGLSEPADPDRSAESGTSADGPGPAPE